MDEFRTLNTLPVAITPDEALSPKTFWASLELPFPVLVDPGDAAAAAYGAVSPDSNRPRRATTLIDRDGIVLMHQLTCPTLDELFATLRGAEHGITPAF